MPEKLNVPETVKYVDIIFFINWYCLMEHI